MFRLTTAGVSHGPGYLAIIDGCPPGLLLCLDDLMPDLRRRRPGQSKIVSQRQEEDVPEIISGVFEGKTDGTSIGILFRNQDQRSQDYADIKDKYRPGHADFTFDAKYGFRDYRGGGRSSARETLCRVAAGAIAKKILAAEGIRVVGYVKQVGPIIAEIAEPAMVTLEQVEATPVRCPEQVKAQEMIALIEEVRKDQDSIGGVCELAAIGVPAGLGEPVFDKLKADLAKALMSLPAVTAFEYGAGFGVANARGSATPAAVPAISLSHASTRARASASASGQGAEVMRAARSACAAFGTSDPMRVHSAPQASRHPALVSCSHRRSP